MADVLINENNLRIDDEDIRAVARAVQDLGYSAEVDPSQRIAAGQASEWWVLYLRWAGDETLHTAFGALLNELARRVARHFRSRGKVPPAQIHLYGPDGRILTSVDVPNDDPGDGFIVRRK